MQITLRIRHVWYDDLSIIMLSTPKFTSIYLLFKEVSKESTLEQKYNIASNICNSRCQKTLCLNDLLFVVKRNISPESRQFTIKFLLIKTKIKILWRKRCLQSFIIILGFSNKPQVSRIPLIILSLMSCF